MKFAFGRVQNILGKGENAGYQNYLLIRKYIQMPSFSSIINSLPNDKILDCSKLKAFAAEKINVTEKLKFLLERIKNIVGKGENAGYQHFLLFPHNVFKRILIRGR